MNTLIALLASPTAQTNASLAVSILGWITMAFAVRHPGMQMVLLDFATLLAGFVLLIGGMFLMIWTGR